MDILNSIVEILAIITFVFLVTSKLIKFFLSDRLDQTIIRNKDSNDLIAKQVFLFEGEDELVLYNDQESLFNITFYEVDYKNNEFVRIKKIKCQNIDKLILGEKLLIHTNIPECIPNLEISWNTITGNNVSAIVSYNGIDGSSISIVSYKKTFISFLFHLFN